MSKKSGNSGSIKIAAIIIALAIIAFAVMLIIKYVKTEEANSLAAAAANEVVEIPVVEVPKLKIVDEESKSRPYAIMINNHHDAWPLCGIQDAYLAYEIIAEGGITRIIALFKDADTAQIGSIRSARHYFVDYAEENDAIFVHWGGSPQAYSRIAEDEIAELDGMALEGSVFFRDRTLNRDYEHTGFTSMANLKEYAEEHEFTRDTEKDLLLDYSIDEINVKDKAGAQSAYGVDIRYSDYHTTSYEYDEERKVYVRSMSDVPNVDLKTGEQYTAKNIIVYALSNYTINDGSGKGRQELENIGTGEGFYITNGYAVPITWEKEEHDEQTVYKYEDGTEIEVNDGNTFIQIYPTSTGKLTITPKAETTTTTSEDVANTVEE